MGPPGSCGLAFLVGMDTPRCETLPHFVLEMDPLISINLRILSIKKSQQDQWGMVPTYGWVIQSQLLKEVGMSPERYIWVQCCLGKESAKTLRPEAAPGLFEERQKIQRG